MPPKKKEEEVTVVAVKEKVVPPLTELLSTFPLVKYTPGAANLPAFNGSSFGGCTWTDESDEKMPSNLGSAGVGIALVDYQPKLLARTSKWKGK
mmetsp:Transcript_137155/g.292977  ORF Transcript_137155/g.292977 Transcript_137155/m.292977 type:complete len:94 (-) Transcript_137155:74-355(-)